MRVKRVSGELGSSTSNHGLPGSPRGTAGRYPIGMAVACWGGGRLLAPYQGGRRRLRARRPRTWQRRLPGSGREPPGSGREPPWAGRPRAAGSRGPADRGSREPPWPGAAGSRGRASQWCPLAVGVEPMFSPPVRPSLRCLRGGEGSACVDPLRHRLCGAPVGVRDLAGERVLGVGTGRVTSGLEVACPSGRRCRSRKSVWFIATLGSNPSATATGIPGASPSGEAPGILVCSAQSLRAPPPSTASAHDRSALTSTAIPS